MTDKESIVEDVLKEKIESVPMYCCICERRINPEEDEYYDAGGGDFYCEDCRTAEMMVGEKF